MAYEEPYAPQVELFMSSALSSPDEFLALLTIRLMLTDSLIYPIPSKPTHASSTLNEAKGTVTLWAEFDNPQHVLRPGMHVKVLTEVDEDAVRQMTLNNPRFCPGLFRGPAIRKTICFKLTLRLAPFDIAFHD